MLLQHLVQVLHHVLATVFGQRGHGYAHQLAVVHRIQAEVGRANRLLDSANLAYVPGLYGYELRLGSAYIRELVQRHLRTVGFHYYAVEHMHAGASGAGRPHLLAKVLHRLLHPRFQLRKAVFQRWNRRHLYLSHSDRLTGKSQTCDYKPPPGYGSEDRGVITWVATTCRFESRQ